MSIYIGFDGPLDQFFMHQPENLFSRPIENAQVMICLPISLWFAAHCAGMQGLAQPLRNR